MQIDDPAYESLYRYLATFSLVVATILMVLCEANIIGGLWYRPTSHDYGLKRFTVPFFIVIPFVLAFVFRLAARKHAGGISAGASALIDFYFAVFLMIEYICLLSLANLAF